MARLALAMAFVISACSFLLPKFFEMLGRPPLLFLDLALCIPAVALGSICWWKGRSYASRWPVVLCVGLVWLSLLYPGHSELLRGTYIAALVTIPLPLAALIVERRAWAFCAKVYVWANAVAMLIAVCIESRTEGTVVNLMARFGLLLANDGYTLLANPNQVGGQFGLASILAFILYLKDREHRGNDDRSLWPEAYLGMMVWLAIGCMLTASRGAFASWLIGIAIVYVWGTHNLSMSRAKDLVALSAAGILVVLLVAASGKGTPWDSLTERFSDKRTNSNLSGRTDVWLAALKAWQSSPDFVWRGTGAGMADNVLGQYAQHTREDEEGMLRTNCHNAFVEWVLSLGVVGIIAGMCLAGSITYQTARLDGLDRNVGRTAILACVFVFAVGAVSYRHPCWPATGALVLAMLTEPTVRRRDRSRTTDSQEADMSPRLAGWHMRGDAVTEEPLIADATLPSHPMNREAP